MRDAVGWSPEGEAIVERFGQFVGEFDRSRRTAVNGFINLKIRGVVANREQISDICADALHVAELELFGAGNDSGAPVRAAIGGDSVGAVDAGGPNNLRVDRAHGNEQICGAALLRR